MLRYHTVIKWVKCGQTALQLCSGRFENCFKSKLLAVERTEAYRIQFLSEDYVLLLIAEDQKEVKLDLTKAYLP